MDYKKEYKKIVNELIIKSFPELKDKKIYIYEFNSRKYYGEAGKFIIRRLGISKSLRNAKLILIKGLLAHELSHLSIFEERNFLKRISDIKYWFNKKRRTKEENNTIRLAIKKGYAKETYEISIRQRDNPYRKDINRYYLTPAQIKSYAKSIGQWK